MLDDIECEEERVAEGGGDPVVGGGGPGQEVDSWGVKGACYVAGGGDREGEEGWDWCHC